MFKFIIQTSIDQPGPGLDASANMSATVESGGASVSSPTENVVLNPTASARSARGKAAIITSLLKLVLIPFVAALFCYIYDDIADLKKLPQGFDNFTPHHKAFPHFITQIFTSLIGYLLGKLACSMCMQRLAFALPLVVATPFSLLLAMIQNQNIVLPFRNGDYKDPYLYVISVLLLAAQFLSVGYYVFKEQSFIMAKESSLFWMPTYNGKKMDIITRQKNKLDLKLINRVCSVHYIIKEGSIQLT